MSFRDEWVDLTDATPGVENSGDEISVEPINQIAHGVIDLEEENTNKAYKDLSNVSAETIAEKVNEAFPDGVGGEDVEKYIDGLNIDLKQVINYTLDYDLGVGHFIGDFIKGNLDENGNIEASNIRICSENYFCFDYDIQINISGAVTMVVCTYNDNLELINRTSIKNSVIYVEKNVKFRIMLRYNDGSEITDEMIPTLVSVPWFTTNMERRMTNCEINISRTIRLLDYNNPFLPSRFDIGTLGTDGQYLESGSRIYSIDYMRFEKDTTLILDNEHYTYVVCLYNDDEEKTLLSRTIISKNVNQVAVEANRLFRIAIYAYPTLIAIKPDEIYTYAHSVSYVPEIINQIEAVKIFSKRLSFDFLRCFTSFTTIGDSLMAGFTSDGTNTVSSALAKQAKNNWVSYLCSRLNRPLTNLAVGSSTAENWRYANQDKFPETNIENANVETSCYFLGLGVNDLRKKLTIGTSDDILEDYNNNPNTFYGNYDYLVRKLKAFNPYAKIFVFTLPKSENRTNLDSMNAAIKYIASIYDNVYCIELNAVEEYETGFIANNLREGHYTPIAYNYMSVLVENLINDYIYKNYTEFMWIPYNY